MDPSFREQLLTEIEKIRAESGATEVEAYALLQRIVNDEGDGKPLLPKEINRIIEPKIVGVRLSEEEHEDMRNTPHRWQYFKNYKMLINRYHRNYRDVDREAAIWAIFLHHRMAPDVPLPEWLSDFLVKGAIRYASYEARTIGEAFGVSRKRGLNLGAARQRQRLEVGVWFECEQLVEQGRPIDDGLFDEVGQKFGIGKTLASECYYGIRKGITITR